MTNADLTKAALAPVHLALKPRGFRKNGPTFTRDSGAVIHMVNIQKSRSSSAVHVKLTANFGIWVKTLSPVRAGVSDKENIWSAHWRMRIGELVGPEHSDMWWSARTIAEADAVGREIADRILNYAIPKFDNLPSAVRLVELWRSGSRSYGFPTM